MKVLIAIFLMFSCSLIGMEHLEMEEVNKGLAKKYSSINYFSRKSRKIIYIRWKARQ